MDQHVPVLFVVTWLFLLAVALCRERVTVVEPRALRCQRCKYPNLGLPADACCPECGTEPGIAWVPMRRCVRFREDCLGTTLAGLLVSCVAPMVMALPWREVVTACVTAARATPWRRAVVAETVPWDLLAVAILATSVIYTLLATCLVRSRRLVIRARHVRAGGAAGTVVCLMFIFGQFGPGMFTPRGVHRVDVHWIMLAWFSGAWMGLAVAMRPALFGRLLGMRVRASADARGLSSGSHRANVCGGLRRLDWRVLAGRGRRSYAHMPSSPSDARGPSPPDQHDQGVGGP